MQCAHCGRPITSEEYYYLETPAGTRFVKDTCAPALGFRWPETGDRLRLHPAFDTLATRGGPGRFP